MPASTGITMPVMIRAASDSRKAIGPAISSGDAPRPMGVRSHIALKKFFGTSVLTMGVSTNVGATALTRTLCRAHSTASVFIMPFTAHFEVTYGRRAAWPPRPLIELIATVAPSLRANISRPKAWQVRKTPIVFTGMTRSSSARVRSAEGIAPETPAQATSPYVGPRLDSTSSAVLETAASLRTSTAKPFASPPANLICSTDASIASLLMSRTATLAPLWAKRDAVAKPMPEAAPVIAMTRPSNPKFIVLTVARSFLRFCGCQRREARRPDCGLGDDRADTCQKTPIRSMKDLTSTIRRSCLDDHPGAMQPRRSPRSAPLHREFLQGPSALAVDVRCRRQRSGASCL